MIEQTVDVAQFEEKTETKSIAMSPTSSRSSAEEDGSDHRSDTDTIATSEDECDLKSEQIFETTTGRTEKTEKSQSSVKIESPSSSPRVIPAADPEQSEKQYLSLHQYLLPKLRLLKILLEIDLFAGCIIIGNTVLDGFLNSLKTSTATLLTAAILELIMTKQTDARLIIRLLTLHLIYEFCGQTLSALNCYARRRAKRPLQKKLGLDLMKAYAALPYEMMLNKEIGRDFTEANPL